MSSFSAHSLIQLTRALDLLSRPQGCTIQDLMEDLEISRRSVYRVFDLLASLGIPLEDDQMFHETVKRFFLQGEYVQRTGNITLPNLPGVSLNLQEALVLEYLFQTGGVFKNTSTGQALGSLKKKLSVFLESPGLKLPGAGLDSLFQITRKMTKDYSGKEDLLGDLTDAILGTRTCTVTYHSFSTDQIKTYDIHPLKILEHKGGLYAFVRVVKHSSIILLAVERIQELKIQEQCFEYPEDFDSEALLESAFDLTMGEPLYVKVEFSPREARFIRERRWAQDQSIEDQEDGGLILAMTTSGMEDIKRWVLQFGKGARVLEPPALREAVESEARGILERE